MSHGYRPNQRIQVAGIPGVHSVHSLQVDTITITLGAAWGSKFTGENVTVEASRVHPLPRDVEVWPGQNLNPPPDDAA